LQSLPPARRFRTLEPLGAWFSSATHEAVARRTGG